MRVFAEKSDETAEKINKDGGKAISVPGDILDDNYINELVKKAAEFGGGKIHVIVNNAGFTWDGVIHKVSHRRHCDGNDAEREIDHRQAMGYHPRPPQYRTVQAHPSGGALLPRQGW